MALCNTYKSLIRASVGFPGFNKPLVGIYPPPASYEVRSLGRSPPLYSLTFDPLGKARRHSEPQLIKNIPPWKVRILYELFINDSFAFLKGDHFHIIVVLLKIEPQYESKIVIYHSLYVTLNTICN